MANIPKGNTLKGLLHKVHAKMPEKTPVTPKALHSNLKGLGRVKPGHVDKKAAKDNTKLLEHARRSSENLHKMGASSVAHAATGSVAGRSLDALKNKMLGKSADPVAALLAKIEGLPDSEAAGILAEELINSNVGVA